MTTTQTETPTAEAPLLPGLPYNPTTGKAYKGDNVPALLATQVDKGYPTSQWAGYDQWLEQGRQVRRGERAAKIKKVVTFKDSERRGVKMLCVFNLAQTDAIVAEATVEA